MLSFAHSGIVLGDDPAPPAQGDGVPDREGVEFFEQHIRPVLVERCYKCHAAGDKPPQGGLRLDDPQAMRSGGDSGPAVVPGKTDESLLLDAIEYSGEFYDMPPDGKLPAEVIASFRRWVAMGAPDPRKAASQTPAASNADESTSGGAASPADLWVLRPLERPSVPAVGDVSWPSGDVDRFILANLERHKLRPAGAAIRWGWKFPAMSAASATPSTCRPIRGARFPTTWLGGGQCICRCCVLHRTARWKFWACSTSRIPAKSPASVRIGPWPRRRCS
jgi:hypothetical protein